MEKIGLIAGNRKFPILLAQGAKKFNYSLVAVGVRGDTSASLAKYTDKFYWLSLAEFSRLFKIFKDEGIKKVVMAGQISPHRLFSNEVKKDPQLNKILKNLKDKRADTIFGAIADKLKEEGFELLDSTILLKDYMAAKGVLGVKFPEAQVSEDITFGQHLAKEIGRLDIGQTVAVKDKAIVAVEALEGTDNVIRRAGKISRGGFTLVKMSKPKQDMRFDIPVIGFNTVKNLVRANAACLAVEAGQTLFIDKEESLRLANRKGLVVIGI